MKYFKLFFALSTIALVAATHSPAEAQYDHLKCFKTKDVKLFKKASADISAVRATFGINENCKINPQAKLLCIPATKTVTEIEEGTDTPFAADELAFDQTCYKIKCPQVDIAPQEVTDQFGTRDVDKLKASLLCMPAFEGGPAPTTTTTTVQESCFDQDADTYLGFTAQCPSGTDCDDNSAGTYPGAPEVCDGLDNDCDNVVDNGNPDGGAACSTGLAGQCAAGLTACQGGQLVCAQTVSPSAEVCDGLDNDCDGTVDNGNPDGGAACSTGLLGQCAAGETACQGGALVCSQTVGPSAEICDSVDNDCDGLTDDDDPSLIGGPCP